MIQRASQGPKNGKSLRVYVSAAAVLFPLTLAAVSKLAAEEPKWPAAAIRDPLGLPPVPYPERNPPTPEKIALGAKLFSDPRLSIDGTMSCASCHDPAHAFTTAKPPVRDPKIADTRLRRDVPSLLNVAYATPLHHDGGEPTLEVQMLAPLFNAAEMGNTTFEDLTNRLAAISEYRDQFEHDFHRPPTIETLGEVLAAYERSLVAGNALFDRWRRANEPMFGELAKLRAKATGEDINLSDTAQQGFSLFTGKAGCVTCHQIANSTEAIFTTNELVNTGIGFKSEARRAAETPSAPSDRGREEVTHSLEDRYKFRTPTLRNVELTAPYMHDGSIKTLEDVIAYYNAGGSAGPEKDPRIKPLGLTQAERAQLRAFLLSLTSDTLPAPVSGRATTR